MEEAVEICKLRLFLKLVAQIDHFQDIEPLPDIDFNIRAGNTLVGFATYAEAERAITSKLDFDNTMGRIEQKAQEVERAFHNFRTMQTAINVDPELMAEVKQQVRSQLAALNDELDRYLANEYGIDRSNIPNQAEHEKRFTQWRQSHQPFHWFVEFYGIMKNGGFDVIIGNPPYVEYSKVKKEYEVEGYKTISCNNLYTYVIERSLKLQAQQGHLGMIVPISTICTERMIPLQKLALYSGKSWISSFDMRPSQLFTGVSQRLSIYLNTNEGSSDEIYLGGYRRWHEEERSELLRLISYINVLHDQTEPGYFPKIANSIEASIAAKLGGQKLVDFEVSTKEHPIYVHRIIRYFVKAIDFIPYFWNEAQGQKKSEDYKPFFFRPDSMYAIGAILNSSLFYWFWRVYSDGFHCGYRDVRAFRLGFLKESEELPVLNSLGQELMSELRNSTTRKTIVSKATGRVEYDEFSPGACLTLINEIDRVLAQHYGFTDEELDFIINYDIKYRMGRSDEDGEGE